MSVFRVKKTLVRTVLVVGFAAGLSATLQGCFLAVAGAAGGGALVATDRRTLGAQTEDREMQVKALAQISQNLPDNAHVNVTVFNRRVLLTGEVAGEGSTPPPTSTAPGLSKPPNPLSDTPRPT